MEVRRNRRRGEAPRVFRARRPSRASPLSAPLVDGVRRPTNASQPLSHSRPPLSGRPATRGRPLLLIPSLPIDRPCRHSTPPANEQRHPPYLLLSSPLDGAQLSPLSPQLPPLALHHGAPLACIVPGPQHRDDAQQTAESELLEVHGGGGAFGAVWRAGEGQGGDMRVGQGDVRGRSE